ncbi:MAG: ATP-binding protein [Patescibacteria group bacterium]
MALWNFNSLTSRLKVKTKFILILILVAYSSIFLVGAASYLVGRNIINDRVNFELEFTTETIMADINHLIYDRFGDLEILQGDLILSDPEALEEEKTEVLRQSLITFGWYDNFYLTDLEGNVLSSSNTMALDQNVGNEAWFTDLEYGEVSVTDAIESPFSEQEYIIFSNTLSDSDNNVFGFIFAEFSLDVMDDLLSASPDDVDVFLSSQDGTLIAEKRIHEEAAPNSYISQRLESEGYFGFNGNDWELLVQIPRAIAYAPLNEFALLLWFSVLVVSVEVILLGGISASRLVKPIQILTEGVGKIEKGNLDHKIRVDTKDEFGFLAENFNKMTETLSEKNRNLLAEKGKYKSILESTDEGIVLFDSTHHVIAFNQPFKKMFNHDPLPNEGPQDIFSFLKTKSDNPLNKLRLLKIQSLIDSKDFKENIEMEITVNEPSYRILYLYSRPVVTDEGQLLGRIWSFSDVTEKREAEKSKDEFIRLASHKLRTPLTAINWSVQMMVDNGFGSVNEDQKVALKQISMNAERLNSLAGILLDVAEISENTLTVNPEEFVLGDLLQRVYEKNLHKYSGNEHYDLQLEKTEDAFNQKVKADPKKVEKILSTLLSNSYVYSKAGEVNHVQVRTKLDLNLKKIILSVHDTGIGISKQDQANVFKKFYRGERAMLNFTEGVGLELFLAKTILDSSREKIWFESEEDKGSAFYFTISLV